MDKKAYLLIGAAVIIIVIIIGACWQFQKIGVSPETQELAYETESLSQDIAELKEIEQDTALDTLDQDLLALVEEIPETIQAIEDLESELDAELDGLLNDLTDLEGFEGDISLDDLDVLLSGFE